MLWEKKKEKRMTLCLNTDICGFGKRIQTRGQGVKQWSIDVPLNTLLSFESLSMRDSDDF